MNTWPVIDMTATGMNIVRMRQNAGLTVKDLQDIFGFSTPQAIYKWQRGTAMPTVDNLVVLAAVFGVTIDDILVYGDCFQIQVTAERIISSVLRADMAPSTNRSGHRPFKAAMLGSNPAGVTI